MKHTLFFAILLALLPALSSAHEYWIDAESYQITAGETMLADLRNGEKFEGAIYSYFEHTTERFELWQNGKSSAIIARSGDRPALNMTAPAEGLVSVIFQSTLSRIKYREMDKFESFVTHKDLTSDGQAALERHNARGLPDKGFREGYTRFSKALIAVGEGAGTDSNTGMEIEFVALANPYTDDLSAGLALQLLYQGQPLGDTQVEIFERSPNDTVAISTARTNAAGEVTIKTRAGHVYLIDAVVLRAPSSELTDEHEIVWESLWAALTFSIPD